MVETNFDNAKTNYVKTTTELENTKRELDSIKGMLSMIEIQHTEYVTRLRSDNKKLIAKQEVEIRIMEMHYEDLRSLSGK